MTILQFPGGSSPTPPESTDPASPSPHRGSVQPSQTSTGLFLCPPDDQPRALHGSSGAAAISGAGPASSSGPAPILEDEDEPSMTTLRKAAARALLDGDVDRADVFRGVIASRVARGQALPSSLIPDDAA